jgi:hypothetical protein
MLKGREKKENLKSNGSLVNPISLRLNHSRY